MEMNVYLVTASGNKYFIGKTKVTMQFSVQAEAGVWKAKFVEIEDALGQIARHETHDLVVVKGQQVDFTIDVTAWDRKGFRDIVLEAAAKK